MNLRRLFSIASGVVFAAAAATQAAENRSLPDLASDSWLALGIDWADPPPGMGRGPIRNDPAFPLRGNRAGPGPITQRIGDTKDPVLKPWAAKQMQESNDEVLSGRRGLPFSAQSVCYPGGVPEQLLTPAQPFYFIQTPSLVWMIWESDHMVRRVRMTDRHSANVKPSWFGESIGHYENGDTLVVDTIGLQAKNSYIDTFRTPHTEKLHVVERFKLSADGKQLEALVTVEDPDAFNAPISMMRRWNKVPNPRLEMVCAENNGDHFGKNLFPVPQDDSPDF